ncbi:hypothetical protein ENUP19_0121G0058 [Entamoeba nuttalli]|uniref:DNA/RNA-binding protein Alba-like domain-containing protein n=2 Tax=Entamoeba nuttalli TaxID=412467 RepID=K2GYR1_ENTNP|nr:hypothetical protein ENU1_145150 [Entamoeba nuttalli P19]EKE38982.1 hypothetical protein ENU1_145150 [Entamoeba nuttalli P19]|eukprot:XP_008858675.1 hypothetical protein ENU1_145150 [Entamoeba nuttalli P19]
MSEEKKVEVKTFTRQQRPKVDSPQDEKIHIGANSYISRIIFIIRDSLETKNKPSVTIRGLGRGANTALRATQIIQRVLPCHVIVKSELFSSQDKFVCDQDKKEISIPRLMSCVEITFSLVPPKDINVPGYMAPLTEEQLEIFKNRPKRRFNRRPGYVNRNNRNRRERGKKENTKSEEKKEVVKSEEKKEQPKEERERGSSKNDLRSRARPKGYGRYYKHYDN